MRLTRRLALAAALSGACVVPTDRSGSLRVEVGAIPTLLIKDSLRLAAQVVDSAGTVVANAAIAYASSDATVLIADAGGMVRAVGVGTATVTVSAIGFADAAPFTQMVRVRGKLEVDSLRPRSVRFGDSVEIFGVGLVPESLFSVSLGGVETEVSAFVPRDPERPEREAMLRVWVPPPAGRRSTLTLLGFAGGVFVPDSIVVAQRDLYEPNDTAAWHLGPLPNGLRNPALALESRQRETTTGADRQPADWYTFDNTATQDRTIVFLSEGGVGQAFGVFITDSLRWSSSQGTYLVGPTSWTVGLETYLCGGLPFTRNGVEVKIDEVLFPISIVALRGLPAGRYHILAPFFPFGTPTRYELVIANQYLSVLAPDAAEENDYCDVATPLPAAANTPFTIDNPHDIDWFKFTVPVARAFSVTVTAANAEADLDLYLVRDFRPDSLVLVSLKSAPGQSETLSGVLPAGNYFLVVVDFPGRTTQYTMSASLTATGASLGGTDALGASPAGPAAGRPDEVDAALAQLREKRARSKLPRVPPEFVPRGRSPW